MIRETVEEGDWLCKKGEGCVRVGRRAGLVSLCTNTARCWFVHGTLMLQHFGLLIDFLGKINARRKCALQPEFTSHNFDD